MGKIKIRDEQKGVIFIALIILMAVALSIVFAFSLKTNTVEDALKEKGIMRTLFVVEDDDSSMLFSSLLIYNPSSKKAALVNLPGHTGAIYQSLGRVDKLEKVYSEAGIVAYRAEVEKLLGMTIPYYTILTLENFIKISDYLGGMRVFISEPVDCLSEEGVRWLLPSGAINLDGDKINTYLHYRLEDETEADVQERYQNAMAAFITGIHDKKFIVFANANRKRYLDFLKTNLNPDEETTLFEAIADVDAESIIKQTITGSLRRVDGQQLLMPDNNGEFIKEAVKQTTNLLASKDGTLTSRVYVLEIQNGTTTQGLARNTAILFQNASYDVLSPVNAPRNDYEETVIIDHIGNMDVAKIVGEFIRCTNIREATPEEEAESSSLDAGVDFTIILGKDFDGRYVQPSRR
ncbi:MAG: LCP family protein [Treponema sp.]|nr:LCP family protein [Treponema sp.]MDY3721992.1 LCP family protein [Treponema sp.]MDY5757155.1 LCP family protein [Treponema sp.]MDY5818231.1 LCP family protein [Treponema sp.]